MARLALGAVLTALLLPIVGGIPVASAQAAEPFRLDRVVPPETFLVLTAPDVAALERGFSRSALESGRSSESPAAGHRNSRP